MEFLLQQKKGVGVGMREGVGEEDCLHHFPGHSAEIQKITFIELLLLLKSFKRGTR